jgi:hemerythrin-like domain-containing protein
MQHDHEKSIIPRVIENLRRTLKGEPHSLEDVRTSLDDTDSSELDLISLLEVHHDYLNESISVLIDRNAFPSEKQLHLTRFSHLLMMHAKAEEETLYRSLQRADTREARLEGLAGQDEHNIAYQLIRELQDLSSGLTWSEDIDAKARVVAEVMANHIREEEGQMFPTAKRRVSGEELHSLSFEYLQKCKKFLDMEMKGSDMRPPEMKPKGEPIVDSQSPN